MVNDYSKGDELKIMSAIFPYVITFTQQQAGFSTEIDEEILYVDMSDKTKMIVKKLEKDLVVEGKDEVILADTPVKLMQKLHQLWSGTVKFESGNSMVIDTTKAEFIRSRFSNKKIGIFYKFKEELNALQQVFGDSLTTELDKFDNEGYQVIALQIISGREGISLRNAEYLVFYNIDFSATSYWQARDRLTTMERKFNKVYWIFSKGGIEDKIYKTVKAKKKYTVNIFKKDYEKKNETSDVT
jgi:aspartate/glutamate racemase